jgi:uncharacterized protein (TIGR02271 family)
MNQSTDFFRQPADDQQAHPNQPVNQADGSASVIPVIEEHLQVGKKVVETGRIRVTKTIQEHQESVNLPLNQEEVNLERVAVNQYVTTPPPPVRYEGDTMIIPVMQEVLVVEKRLLLVEELHITKRQVQKQETQQVTLRKEEVNVERVAQNPTNGPSV